MLFSYLKWNWTFHFKQTLYARGKQIDLFKSHLNMLHSKWNHLSNKKDYKDKTMYCIANPNVD